MSLYSKQQGFTLIELLVSVSIFVFMTAFLVGKYGTFNQSVLVTNTAYDIALTIRNAQSYGLNVKQSAYDASFQHPFGAHFVKGSNTFYFFNDVDLPTPDGVFVASYDQIINTTSIKKGITVYDIQATCAPSISASSVSSLDVTFKRPDPDAIIKVNGNSTVKCQYAEIVVRAPDGSTKKIIVRSTGQIAIED